MRSWLYGIWLRFKCLWWAEMARWHLGKAPNFNLLYCRVDLPQWKLGQALMDATRQISTEMSEWVGAL